MRKLILITLAVLSFFFCAPLGAQEKGFSVLQINIWQEGTVVPQGFEAIGDEILDKNPDVVTFSEIRNYKDTDFIQRIIAYLKAKGNGYYGLSSESSLDVGVIAKYPIEQQEPLYKEDEKMGNVLKTRLNIHDTKILLYSVHLDYTHYACYLPRGYDGATWKEMEQPIVDVEKILIANRKSKRDEAIRDIIADVEKENTEQFILIAGDFNEPSHLDWTEETKNLFDHRGAVVPWDASVMLMDAGFVDAFRTIYPNPVTHPGFTFPSYNKDVDVSKLTWAPKSDERDRIDFIYFVPHQDVSLERINVVGPVETVAFGQKKPKDSDDEFLLPKGVWPTDHKALMAIFNFSE